MVAEKRVSKAEFEPRVRELLQEVERTGEELVITDQGRPVLRIVPCARDSEALIASLRGSVLRYDDPFEPLGDEEWEACR